MSTSVRTIDDFARWATLRAPNVTFVGPDPHYGIGLEAVLPGYAVACIDEVPAAGLMRAAGVDVFALGPAAGGGDADPRSTAALVESPPAAAWLRRRARATPDGLPLLVFKTAHRLESRCRNEGWRLLASDAALGRRWENKVAFRALAEGLGLRQPPGRVVARSEMDYGTLAKALGPRMVVQAPYGYAGMQSHLVASADDLAAALAAARSPQWRVTAFLDGTPMSVNACATARGVAVGAPFLQLTGLQGITPYRLGSCGQDWTIVRHLDVDAAAIARAAASVGTALAGEGFRGVFGVDFVQGQDGALYVIETNARLIASIALYTQLELADGRLPLLARHIMAHLDPEADRAPLDAHGAPLSGGQVVLHHTGRVPVQVAADVATGAWSLSGPPPRAHTAPLEGAPTLPREATGASAPPSTLPPVPDGVRPTFRVDGCRSDEALVLMPAPGRGLAPGAAHARLQVMGRGVATADGRLVAEIGALAERVARAVDPARPQP